jgi:hypothetical protein
LAHGRTNPQIADHLGITLDGAKYHVSEVIARLNVDSREEAADWWREQNGVVARFRALIGLSALKWAAAGAVVAGVSIAAVVVLVSLRDDATSTVADSATPEPDAPEVSWGQGVPLSDGLRWVFVTGGPGARAVVLGSESGSNRVIGAPGDYSYPVLSPDGRWLALTESDEGETLVHIVDTVSGEGVRFPTPNPGPPEWAPDSRRVAVATTNGLFIADTEGNGLYADQSWPDAWPYWRYFTWSPDGQHMALATREGFYILDKTGKTVASRLSADGEQLNGECWGGSYRTGPIEYPWSPDSRKVAAIGPASVVVLAVDGSRHEIALPELATVNEVMSRHLGGWAGDSIVLHGPGTPGAIEVSMTGWAWGTEPPDDPEAAPDFSPYPTDEQARVFTGVDPWAAALSTNVQGADRGEVILFHLGAELEAGVYRNYGELRLLDVPRNMKTVLWADQPGVAAPQASFVLVGAGTAATPP